MRSDVNKDPVSVHGIRLPTGHGNQEVERALRWFSSYFIPLAGC
jgi:hypothetical protein